MKTHFDLAVEISEEYDFNSISLNRIEDNRWVKNQYPLVYFIKNNEKRLAYVGESTNGLNRIKNHLSNPERKKLNKISIIGSDKFNKSATLDIESKLIQYIHADGSYELQNGNGGHTLHNYYQQDLYKSIFKEIWHKLIEKKVVSKSLEEIENSSIFKYSPYKSLNADQYYSVISIVEALASEKNATIVVNGSAGTGKTILATYLFKLLMSDNLDIDEELTTDEAIREVNAVRAFKEKYKNPKIGFVIAMTSLRETIQKVFKNIDGLSSSMVISPSDTFKKEYDILIVDEAHRLRQYKNISWRGVFKKNNAKLGLDNSGNELNWIMANGKNQVLFYDNAQSVKPSDVPKAHFDKILSEGNTQLLELKSQMRVTGGNDYISFVDHLLKLETHKLRTIKLDSKYELLYFDSLKDLYSELKKKNDIYGLARLIAGYSWEWRSDPKKKPTPDLNAIDIEIDGLKFQWNKTDKDWINSDTSFNEIGCIHTTQGYDLNYAGIIFGKEIILNPQTNQIEIIKENYFDTYGRIGVDDDELKDYIINIYKTMMYRGIKGTFVYACDEHLRSYLKQHLPNYQNEISLRIIKNEDVKPFINAVPIYDLKASAGEFSPKQYPEEYSWIELPNNISHKEGMFVCQVVGESMNQKIPNGSWCLFKKDEGGSRNGLITLVELSDYTDPDSGSSYTVKEYSSQKIISEGVWKHESITLLPKSTLSYEPIKLMDDETVNLEVVGIFMCVIE